jgi:predicted 3-demethylubiquinone-9 3-methyltransferase (glyoxalase superfamily)
MKKITPFLWFNKNAEEAMEFYISIFPDSKILDVSRIPVDNPSGKAGEVMTGSFRIAGQEFMVINGGPYFQFNEAVSFVVDCEDQTEIDRFWNVLTADGGEPGQCGWLKDKFGLSWQIVPKALPDYLGGSDPAGAKRAMEALLKMGKIEVATLKRAYEGK